MISVDKARSLVLAQAEPLQPRQVALDAALGCVLAEAVTSDIDSPPHDKSLVDGYAVTLEDMKHLPAELDVQEEVTAGQLPQQPLIPGRATRIMTGAPVPVQTDAVVMVEDTDELPAVGSLPRVRLHPRQVLAGQNVMRRGTSLRRDEIVIHPGHEVRPIEIGLLAEVGATRVVVRRTPRVAVLSTGNELVPCTERPAAGEIRNSNGSMLDALVTRAGGQIVNLGIGRDLRDELTCLVRQGLEQDVLVLSGGVSAGVLDLVPDVLSQLHVRQVFHKVRLKPGKPLWFGLLEQPTGNRLVFGLPGNPVSSLVCFELFVRPAIRRLAGKADASNPTFQANLTSPFRHRGDRPTYYPVRRISSADGSQVEPLQWKGSADLRTLAEADGLAIVPAGDHDYQEGETLNVMQLQ
jgi:molybdopterin molybdotransferase